MTVRRMFRVRCVKVHGVTTFAILSKNCCTNVCPTIKPLYRNVHFNVSTWL